MQPMQYRLKAVLYLVIYISNWKVGYEEVKVA